MKNIDYVRSNLNEIIEKTNEKVKIQRKLLDWNKISTKLKSELISNFLETSFSEVLSEVEAPKSDHLPDLLVKKEPLEIKTAKTTRKWRGGEYSKRESDYLMVSYDDSDDSMKWFFLYTYLKESDWKSSVSENYYATSIDLDYILDNTDYEILKGGYEKKIKLRHLICD